MDEQAQLTNVSWALTQAIFPQYSDDHMFHYVIKTLIVNTSTQFPSIEAASLSFM